MEYASGSSFDMSTAKHMDKERLTVNWKENFWNMKKYMGEVKVMLKLTNACRG